MKHDTIRKTVLQAIQNHSEHFKEEPNAIMTFIFSSEGHITTAVGGEGIAILQLCRCATDELIPGLIQRILKAMPEEQATTILKQLLVDNLSTLEKALEAKLLMDTDDGEKGH